MRRTNRRLNSQMSSWTHHSLHLSESGVRLVEEMQSATAIHAREGSRYERKFEDRTSDEYDVPDPLALRHALRVSQHGP